MQRFEVLEVSDQDRWIELLDQVEKYDFYHLPSYHRLSEISGEGKGVLLSYISDDLVVLFPLLIRNIDAVPGLESVGQDWYDAVSVYGYAGPIASRYLKQNEKDLFWGHLVEYFNFVRLVYVFSSFHPLFKQESIFHGFGEIIPTSPTISIDLTLSPDEQWRNYRKGHRKGVKKLNKLGYECIEDKNMQYWEVFIELYYKTMKRLNASSYYFFPEEYFSFIKEQIQDRYRLFVCMHNKKVVNASLYTFCQNIIQAHFEGVHEDYAGMSTGKLVEDTVRLWGNEIGAHSFHLGRGLGGAKDSLYYYKKGFSKREHPFYYWSFINNRTIYQQLVQEQYRITGANPGEYYFPLYRHPAFLESK